MNNYVKYLIVNVEQLESSDIFKGETLALLSDGTWITIHSKVWIGEENATKWYKNSEILDVSTDYVEYESIIMALDEILKDECK